MMEILFNIFENPSELETTTSERTKLLSEIDQIAKRESELYALIKDLQVNKEKIRKEERDLRWKIQRLEDEARTKKVEEEKLEKLKVEAASLEEYSSRLEEICRDFPAFAKARPYQKEDLVVSLKAFLENKNGILNGNDMSMGKTFEAVILLYAMKQLNPKAKILWLTKKSLTISTPLEILRWWPEVKIMTSAVATGPVERKLLLEMMDMGGDFLVANYEFVRTTPKLMDIKWNYVVVDEAHKLKGGANPGGATDIWKAVKKLCLTTDFNIFLTGTPMVNRPEEMWSYLNIFDEKRFPTLRQFQSTFNLYKGYTAEANVDVKATNLLQDVLRGQMFRRTRNEVGLQLPDIQPETILLDMLPRQREVYDQMKKYFFIWLDEQEGKVVTATAILAQLIRLRQINVWPANIRFGNDILDIEESSKIDECMDIIDRVNEQIVIFSTFNEPLFEVGRRAKKEGLSCEILYGDTSWDVARIEKEFQANHIDVLCLNSAVGEGLNLQKDKSKWAGGASYGILLDKWWSPSRNEQCLSRIVRPGSDNKGVFYYLENQNSVDKFINDLCNEKQASFDTIAESQQVRPNWKQYLGGVL